jgi:hypothetical protein
MPGCSIEHYIIKMVHFILGSMDGDADATVLALPVDYEKAFNRMLHSDILCNLVALNVPRCAVKLIKSYLMGRTMCVRYKGATSSFHKVPGGGPQGGLLTSVLFILQVNKAGGPCTLPVLRQVKVMQPANSQNQEQVNHPVCGQEHDSLLADQPPPSLGQPPAQDNNSPTEQPQYGPAEQPTRGENGAVLPACHKKSNLHKKSFVVDLTLLEKVLFSKLKEKERIIGPLNFHDRFKLTMPEGESILQHQLTDLKEFTSRRHMVLNQKKTKCLHFINSKTKDFLPQLKVNDDSLLEVIYDLKLVGLVVTSDLSWQKHIEYTIKRVNSVIWQITRFKLNGAQQDKLKPFYGLKEFQ